MEYEMSGSDVGHLQAEVIVSEWMGPLYALLISPTMIRIQMSKTKIVES